MPKTKDALKIIDRMIGSDKKLRDMIAAETAKAESRIVEKKKK